jgi:hypothetical protein
VDEDKEEKPALEFIWCSIINEKQSPFLGLRWFGSQDNSNASKSSGSPVPVSPIKTNEHHEAPWRANQVFKSSSPHTQNVEQKPVGPPNKRSSGSNGGGNYFKLVKNKIK